MSIYYLCPLRLNLILAALGMVLSRPACAATPFHTISVTHAVLAPMPSPIEVAYVPKPPASDAATSAVAPLTLCNLLDSIESAGLLFPEIVLAQAVQETGWFRSDLCRTRHNLFGLVNPKDGSYFVFKHWGESVRAYRDKVQYRYRGGDYYLWLRQIGYAGDPYYTDRLRVIVRRLHRGSK